MDRIFGCGMGIDNWASRRAGSIPFASRACCYVLGRSAWLHWMLDPLTMVLGIGTRQGVEGKLFSDDELVFLEMAWCGIKMKWAH